MDFLSIFGTGIYIEKEGYVPPENVGTRWDVTTFFTKRLVSTRRRRRRRRRRSCAFGRFSAILSATSALKAAARRKATAEAPGASLGAISRSSTAILKSFSVGGESVGTGENRGCRSLFSRCSVSVGFVDDDVVVVVVFVVSSRKRKNFGRRSKTSTLGRFPTSPRLYYSLERLQKEISKPNVPVLTASRFLSARFFQPLRGVKVQRRWWTRNLPQRRRECDQTHEARCLALDHLPEKARAPRLALRL